MTQLSYALALGGCALVGSFGSAYAAQPQSAGGVNPGHVARASAIYGSQHRFFGRIVSARDPVLLLRLRNGSVLRVDASRAFAQKRVSEPLFPGKPTVVEGAFEPSGIFAASVVSRAAVSATAWGTDR